MWSIYCQSLQKKYSISIFSRAFIISSLCYIIAFILPILILISIGCTSQIYPQYIDSWNNYQKVFLKPIIKYQNHQIFCLLKDQSTIYDSSFNDDIGKSFQSIISVGTDENKYQVYININSNILSCSILTYNKVIMNNMQILVTIPFNFYHQSTISNISLNKVSSKGKIQIISSSPLMESESSLKQLDYHSYSHAFSMKDNFIEYSVRNLTALINVAYQKETYGNATNFIFEGVYEIQYGFFMKYQSLINNIRLAVPYFIYLWMPLFYFVVVPLIQWMFNNKIYMARVQKAKIKLN